MFARRRSLANLMATVVTAFVMAMLVGAPVSAAALVGFSDQPIAEASSAGQTGRHDEMTATYTHAKSCAKIKPAPPSERQCRHAAGATVALRRPRPDADGTALAPPVAALIQALSGFVIHRPRIAAVHSPPPDIGLRAPFWAIFARASRLRN
ncbi:MAG: hypothetical protein ACR2PI_07810 [Hyphomicrobiaceae bacterium]